MSQLVPGEPTVGVVGGGQLGRMLGEAAAPLGVDLIVLDPTPDCPATPVVTDQIVADFDDEAAMERLAERSDLLTYEIELADPDVLERVGDGVPVQPSPDTLRLIQDKYEQKRALKEAGIPVPEFRKLSGEDAAATMEELGPVMCKARTGGYDGRGNQPGRSTAEIQDAVESLPGEIMAEELIDFDCELSVIGVKGVDDRVVYPPGENIHRDEILRETIVPARVDPETRSQARAVARDVLNLLEGWGTYGIELFAVDGDILVNEIAPRPHNSGHWTIEGSTTSQFENHLRAILGLPLGRADMRTPTAMANLLGDVAEPTRARLSGTESVLERHGAHLHWYGKDEARPLRKLGHVTLTGDGVQVTDPDNLLNAIREIRDSTTFTRDTTQ